MIDAFRPFGVGIAQSIRIAPFPSAGRDEENFLFIAVSLFCTPITTFLLTLTQGKYSVCFIMRYGCVLDFSISAKQNKASSAYDYLIIADE